MILTWLCRFNVLYIFDYDNTRNDRPFKCINLIVNNYERFLVDFTWGDKYIWYCILYLYINS